MLGIIVYAFVTTMGFFDNLYSYGFSGDGHYALVSLSCFMLAAIVGSIGILIIDGPEHWVGNSVAVSGYCLFYSFLWPMVVPMIAPIVIGGLIISPIIVTVFLAKCFIFRNF